MHNLRTAFYFIFLLTLNTVFTSSAFSVTIKAPANALLLSTVSFVATDSSGASTFTWSVDGVVNTNNTSRLDTSFSTVGVKTVSLSITTASGVTQSTFFDINIVANSTELLPEVAISVLTSSISASNLTFNAGTVIIFEPIINSATGTIFHLTDTAKQRFIWFFGDPRSNDSSNLNIQTVQYTPGAAMTASFIYKTPGNYTVTLIAQDNFVANEFNALSGLNTVDITIVDPIVPVVPPVSTEMAQRYIDLCFVCHGSDGTNGIQTPIAGRGVGTANEVTGALIINGYSDPFMALSQPQLTLAEANVMAEYLASLPAQAGAPPLDGKTSYLNRCSVCHGRGIGGSASNIMPANIGTMTEQMLNDAIQFFRQMRHITIPPEEMTLLLDFINTTPVDSAGALMPQPAEGAKLYTMYCAYCHGDNGLGGALATIPITGVGTSAAQIVNAINDDPAMRGLNNSKILSFEEIKKIASTL